MIFKCYIIGRPKGKDRARAAVGAKSGKPYMYTPNKTAQTESKIREKAIAWMDKQGITEPHRGPVHIAVVNMFGKPSEKNMWEGKEPMGGFGDVDNLLKVAMDALNKVLFNDDAQIIDGRAIKRYHDRAGVYIVVKLLPLAEQPKKERKVKK